MDLSPDFTHSGWKNRRIFTPPPVFGCGHLHSSWALKMQAGNDRHRTKLGLGWRIKKTIKRIKRKYWERTKKRILRASNKILHIQNRREPGKGAENLCAMGDQKKILLEIHVEADGVETVSIQRWFFPPIASAVGVRFFVSSFLRLLASSFPLFLRFLVSSFGQVAYFSPDSFSCRVRFFVFSFLRLLVSSFPLFLRFLVSSSGQVAYIMYQYTSWMYSHYMKSNIIYIYII